MNDDVRRPIRQMSGYTHFGPSQDVLDQQWTVAMVEFMAKQIDALERRVIDLERGAQ